MGNSQQINNHGGMVIQTDKPYYFAGEQVIGTIFVDVIHPEYPGHSLILKLKGIEECSWMEDRTRRVKGILDTRARIEHYTQKLENKGVIICNRVPIHNFGSMTLNPGQYAFPFSFILRPEWPGSFEENSQVYSARIAYTITAKIPKTKKSVPTFKTKQPLSIRQQAKQQIGAITGDRTMNVKQCGCCDQGVTYMKCTFDRNCYATGEMANVQIELDNSRCKAAVRIVETNLINTLILQSSTGINKVFNRKICSQQLPGIPGGAVAKDGNKIALNFPIMDQSNQVMGSTSLGISIKSQYTAQIQLEMDGIQMCSDAPKVEIPLQILSQVHLPPQIQQPQNWAPQVFDTQQLQFGQSAMPPPQQFQQMNQGGIFPDNRVQPVPNYGYQQVPQQLQVNNPMQE